MLDVEKKWSVDALAFIARDPSQIWSQVLCLDQLAQILSVPAQIRDRAESLPERKTLTLAQVLKIGSFSMQLPLIRQKLSLLQALRFHATKDVVPLIDDYYQTLAVYLQKRDLADRTPYNREVGGS